MQYQCSLLYLRYAQSFYAGLPTLQYGWQNKEKSEEKDDEKEVYCG